MASAVWIEHVVRIAAGMT